MQFFNPNLLQKQPFKPNTNMSHTINLAQQDSKINPKTIAQRLKVNQSMKNLCLLKRSPLSNLRTLFLGPTSSDRRNADFLFSLFLSPFLHLSSLFLSSLSFLSLPFLFSLSFLFILLSTGCEPPYLYTLQTPCMLTHGLSCVLEGHAF